MIEFINVSKSYKTKNIEKEVLKDVNLVLPDKGFISMLGKSGSGKTTLLNILGGLDDFDSGTYLYNGIDAKTFSDEIWDFYRSNVVAFVFQDDNLIDFLSVKENLEIVIKEQRDEIKNQLIVNTLDKFDLKETVNKKTNELSGGEKQRIAIIRALLKESRVILVDEPTGNLDEENPEIVLNFLKKISKDKLVFMITHDIDYANKYSDEIISIKDGIIQKVQTYNKEIIQPENFREDNKLKLNFKQITNFVLKNIKSNLSKTIQYIILLTISLFMIGLGLSTLFTNEYSIASNTFLKTNMKYIQIKAPNDEVYDNEDYEHWSQLLDNNVYKIFNGHRIYFGDETNNYYIQSPYNIEINSLMYINNYVELLYGEKPKNDNEILISDYLANGLIKNGELSVSDIKDVTGMKLFNDRILIVGIFKTDYEKYQYMLDGDTNFFYSDRFSEGEKSRFNYKIENFYTNIYVSKNFDFSKLNISVHGSFKTKSLYHSFPSIDVTPFIEDDSFDLNDYSSNIISDNQVIVSKGFVHDYLKYNGIYDFESYDDFLDIWNDNEEELSNKVIDETISIHIDYKNQNTRRNGNIRIYFNDYTIVGIDNNNSSNVYINNSSYNSFFENNYSFGMYLQDTVYENEQLLKTIRENDYFYEADGSHEIIKLVDSDGPITSMIAFSISGVFILFTFLLFNNLISRDIFNRKKEIGLLRTLGMPLSNISKLFVFEVLFMATISLILVISLEPFGIAFLNKIITSQTSDLTLIYYNFKVIMGIIIFGAIFTLLSILFPIKKIKKLSLVEAIRGDDKY